MFVNGSTDPEELVFRLWGEEPELRLPNMEMSHVIGIALREFYDVLNPSKKTETQLAVVWTEICKEADVCVCRLRREWPTSRGGTTSTETWELPTSWSIRLWFARSLTLASLESSKTMNTQPGKVRNDVQVEVTEGEYMFVRTAMTVNVDSSDVSLKCDGLNVQIALVFCLQMTRSQISHQMDGSWSHQLWLLHH